MAEMIKCALLSADDLFVKMVELEPGQATDRHVLTIAECDLDPWKFRWVRNQNAFGGTFVPLSIEKILRGEAK